MRSSKLLLTAIFTGHFAVAGEVADNSDSDLQIFYVLPGGEVVLPEEDVNYNDPLSVMRLQKMQNELQFQSPPLQETQSPPSQEAATPDVNGSGRGQSIEEKAMPAQVEPKKKLVLAGSEEVMETQPETQVLQEGSGESAVRQQRTGQSGVNGGSTLSTATEKPQNAGQPQKGWQKGWQKRWDKSRIQYIMDVTPQGSVQQRQVNPYGEEEVVPATRANTQPNAQPVEQIPAGKAGKLDDAVKSTSQDTNRQQHRVKQQSQPIEKTPQDKAKKYYIIESVPQQGRSDLYREAAVPATKARQNVQSVEQVPAGAAKKRYPESTPQDSSQQRSEIDEEVFISPTMKQALQPSVEQRPSVEQKPDTEDGDKK